MNILLSSIGRRGYIADYFRSVLPSESKIIGTTDRHSLNSEFTVGLLSCDDSFILPSVKCSDYIDSLLELCQREKVSMMCSLFDQDCHVLSEHLDKFRSIGVTTFVPNRRVSNICFDKLNTHQFLEKIGVGTPSTFSTIEDFLQSDIAYPVIVKPRYGFASLDIHFAKNEKEILACFDPEVHIIQEILGGEEHSFDIFNDLHGNVLSCVIKRKLKMRAGETDQAITIKNKRLLDLAIFIGEALGHAGPLDVDFFVEGDKINVLEFNPRFGGGYPLAHAAGACFPELMVDITTGQQPRSIVGQYKENIVMLKDMNPIVMPLDSLLSVVDMRVSGE